MRFQFDPHQPYQASAFEAVTDLCDGQPADAAQLVTMFRLLPVGPALFEQSDVSDQVSLDIAADTRLPPRMTGGCKHDGGWCAERLRFRNLEASQ